MDNLFYVKKYDINRRLDNWIFSYFKNIPKSAIYCMIRKGKIRINNNMTFPNYKLKTNDFVKFININYLNNNKNNKKFIHSFFKYENLKNNILYEDNYILIINKPSGISVHGGTKTKYDVISNLRELYDNNYELIHRLDKYTSGILLIAKNKYILKKFHNQFYKKDIYKKYITLVFGLWNKNNKIINLPIYRIKSKHKKSISIIDKLGKKSISLFKIKEYINNMTLLEVNPITGRMHQIRIHTSYLGNPIALDNLYGNIKNNNKLILMGLKRMFLHSYMIEFIHPIYNKKFKIYSSIDNDLLSFLEKLRNYDNFKNN